MTAYVTGAVAGRRAFSLGTGCGKTSAIIAWITAVFDEMLRVVTEQRAIVTTDIQDIGMLFVADGFQDAIHDILEVIAHGVVGATAVPIGCI